MKKKNIDKKVALSIGGLSALCLGLLLGSLVFEQVNQQRSPHSCRSGGGNPGRQPGMTN